MCDHNVKRDIISFVNPYRTPSEFPGPEKRDGEVPPDVTSVSGDPFPPPEVPPTAHVSIDTRIREYEHGSKVGRSGR